MEPVPFSALELHDARQEEVPAARRRALLPWWLNPLALSALVLVLAYRTLVPISYRRRCIYTPTCSQYALDSLRAYGFFRGAMNVLQRLRRCNGALFRGGADPA